MSLELLLPSFSDLGSASILILLVAAALFYFGKLITDVKVEQIEKTADIYVQGLIFSLFFIAFPSFLVWFFSGSLNMFSPITFSLIIQVLILGVLIGAIFFNLGRYTLFSNFQGAFQTRLIVEKEKNPLVNKLDTRYIKKGKNLADSSFGTQKAFANIVTSSPMLFVLSLLLVWTVFSTLQKLPVLSTDSIMIYILTFTNFTFLAINFGYVGIYHPLARIVLDNGQEIAGRLVKIGKFVYLVKEREKENIC